VTKAVNTSSKVSFDEIKKLATKDRWDREAIDALDRFLGVAILLTPVVAGPAGLFALELLQPKDELIKLARVAAQRFVKGKPTDFLARHERLTAAYTLLTYSAFFEALELKLPDLANAVQLTEDERTLLMQRTASQQPGIGQDLAALHSPPHPALSPEAERSERQVSYLKLVNAYVAFVGGLAAWDKQTSSKHAAWRTGFGEVPLLATQLFEAQYLDLLIEAPAFARWAEVREFAKCRQLTADEFERMNKRIGALESTAKETARSIDIGLSDLGRRISANLSACAAGEQVEAIVATLTREYDSRVDEAVIRDSFAADGQDLVYPRKRDIFVPQAYQTTRYVDRKTKLEVDSAWSSLKASDDLGDFIVAYLDSAYSTETPLIVLGHPGSGKSLLTEMLAATLGEQYHPIRIELRDADADAELQDQIERRIRQLTGQDVNWARYAGQLADHPPLIILDGYDELLQASGKVFSNYLNKVHAFQRREALASRPVRVIVTSRITLIDKAAIPAGSTVLRLLDFDQARREMWMEVWNAANHAYFASHAVEPLSLPENSRIIHLAAQPLLLLMLAVYDSAANGLRNAELDRTSLYHSLLTRFIERERTKGDNAETFAALPAGIQRQQIEAELERLGVAAIGMFNRRTLHIHRDDLNRDIAALGLQRSIDVAHGQPLTQAELLLGSFFFIHESRSKGLAESDATDSGPTAFEFLHNTFGEFLTADFILRKVLEETATIRKLSGDPALETVRQQRLTSLPNDWYTRLVYTSLHTRPVVVSMMREWLPHRLAAAGRSRADFDTDLAVIAKRQLGDLLRSETPLALLNKQPEPSFPSQPLLGHLATYSLNLILLWAQLSQQTVTFDEADFGSPHVECRPWDRLTQLWRSWFSLESLATLPECLNANRAHSVVELSGGKYTMAGAGTSRLMTVHRVAAALADNITYGMSSVFLFDNGDLEALELRQAGTNLRAEGIDLDRLVNFRLDRRLEPQPSRLSDLRISGDTSFIDADVLATSEWLDRCGHVGTFRAARRFINPGHVSAVLDLSAYEAAVTIAMRSRVEPLWIDHLLSQLVDAPGEAVLRCSGAASLLRAGAERPFCRGSLRLASALQSDGLRYSDVSLETVVGLFLFADATEASDLARRCLAEIAGRVRARPEEFLDVSERDLEALTDVLLLWLQEDPGRLASGEVTTVASALIDGLTTTESYPIANLVPVLQALRLMVLIGKPGPAYATGHHAVRSLRTGGFFEMPSRRELNLLLRLERESDDPALPTLVDELLRHAEQRGIADVVRRALDRQREIIARTTDQRAPAEAQPEVGWRPLIGGQPEI
jgi:energy-coupling factor transporter ATP-binding protein EcfA2